LAIFHGRHHTAWFIHYGFQWMMGREWSRNPLAWLILIVLLIIVVAIGGAIAGPILVLVARLLSKRRGS
jgi:hypothetical protein